MKDTRPIRVTELGLQCAQVRLSLRETKEEFAKRFYVCRKTIYFWETGQSLFINGLFKEALDRMHRQLNEAGMLIPMETVKLEYQKILKKRGDADDVLGSKEWHKRGRPPLAKRATMNGKPPSGELGQGRPDNLAVATVTMVHNRPSPAATGFTE